jgi:SepF-like predicted cell division protein (DUF552 family)
VTWSLNGVAGPKVDVAKLRRQVASEIDRFVADYSSVNPKLMVTSNNVKLKDEKK